MIALFKGGMQVLGPGLVKAALLSEAPAPQRLEALDLIRGVAVLGILAINMAGFAGPPDDVYGPVTHSASGVASDGAVYALWLVLFEGKMRALFSILFGASMELFVRRAEAAGRDGQRLQLRRLGWLAVFGYLHWLLWWGDILFDYAVAGVAALALRQAPGRMLVAVAMVLFMFWQADACSTGPRWRWPSSTSRPAPRRRTRRPRSTRPAARAPPTRTRTSSRCTNASSRKSSRSSRKRRSIRCSTHGPRSERRCPTCCSGWHC